MNNAFPQSIRRLIEEFAKMPGIGVKSAQRLAFHVLQTRSDDVDLLVKALREVRDNVSFCRTCSNLSEGEICSVCQDASRDRSKICVVEGPSGVIAMEKSGVYHGLYHVLLGALSPIDGVGPEELKIEELLNRVKQGGVSEIIIATDFTTEGETTALYLMKILRSYKVTVTRLARGVPVGASLEYADMATLQRAFEERRDV
ncbi:MAG TPA: recombination mediator RecR [Candidatus Omnitrophota bacterium]|nr:recombination mediator RecR [Candidatus Omnitrophota bacterium]HPS20562.1 recombination mediator RecR [Candidatus Omnitrophota bacterium]